MKKYDVAFFDVDETVINFKTMFSFLSFYLNKKNQDGGTTFNTYMDNVKRQWQENVDREIINREYYNQYSNEPVSAIKDSIKEWILAEKLTRGNDFFIKPVLQLISFFQEQGTPVVFISGSFKEIILPLAEELKVTDVIATALETKNEIYTGKIIPPQTIGQGKVTAVLNYLNHHNFDKENAAAFGDHYSDFPMLEAVKDGFIISNDELIIKEAMKKGFSIINYPQE